jgi:IMP dehydrogenase
MASRRAVQNRTRQENAFSSARKEFFEEGISQNKSYIDKDRPGAEDLIDHIVAGVRSSMAYTGAKTIEEFHEKAVVGIQSAAGFEEGKALHTSWS